MLGRAAVLCLALAIARPAWGDDASEEAPRGSVAAVAVSLVPGVLVHGPGHWVAGENRTARRLLAMQGLGLGTALVGGIPLLATGGSRWVAAPSIALVIGGAALMLTSWAADIYGSAGGGRSGGSPRTRLPHAELRVGYAYVHDPQFDYSSFAVVAADFGARKFRLRPRAWIAGDADNQRFRMEAAHRFSGPLPGAPSTDGSYVEAGFALTHHRFGDEKFANTGAEVLAAARVDLGRLGPSLRGSFGEVSLGLGSDRLRTSGVALDVSRQLLARFAYGMYLGGPRGRHGEVQLYYNHRRDDLAGGLAIQRGGGFVGYVGIDGFVYVSGDWGVTSQLQIGSAYIMGLGIVRRFGGGA